MLTSWTACSGRKCRKRARRVCCCRTRRPAFHPATCASLWRPCWSVMTSKLAADILNNYADCLSAKDLELRRNTAIGLSQIADLYARLGGQPMAQAVRKLSEQIIAEKDSEMHSLLSAAFVRLSQESSAAKNYAAVNEVCAGMELISVERPALMSDLRARVGVENRLPEFIEEAIHLDPLSPEMLSVLRRTSQSGAEHLADRFFRCLRRDECDRMIELVKEVGSPVLLQLREILRTGQPR